MSRPSDTDPPPPPGRYGRHTSLTDDDAEELSVVTRNILAQLKDDDRRHLKARMTISSSPPATKAAGPILISVVSAALFAVASAALVMWRNDAVNEAKQAAMSHWVQGLDADLREHARSQMHAGAREAIATEREQINALNERVKRIEAQIDSPRRQR